MERTNGQRGSGTGATGYLLVLGAALLWAISATVGKDLLAAGVSAVGIAQVRSLVAAAALAVWLAVSDRRRPTIRRSDVLPLLGLGALALAGTEIAYFMAIERLHVAVAILLQYLSPVLVLAFSAAVLRERLTAPKILAAAAALCGCFLVAGGGEIAALEANLGGVAWGLAGAVGFAAYILGSEHLVRRLSPWTVLLYAFAFAGAACVALDPTLSGLAAARDPLRWGQLAYIAVLGTALPFGLFLMGIERIGASRASITAVSEPVFAAVVAFAFLGEALGPWQIAGGLLVLAAVAGLRILS
jgi:drug/metabolite transporter (DMT)-like permease